MLLLAHRGARSTRTIPENTLQSFDLSLRHGCDGFEFDVRLTADGQAVICHDPTYARKQIANTASDLLGLPTLESVLRRFSRHSFLDIELKVPGLASQLRAALGAHPPQKGFVISSFLPEVLASFHQHSVLAHPPNPKLSLPLGLLAENKSQLSKWPESPAEWIIPHFKLVTRELIDQVHAANKKIMLWTVNHHDLMLKFSDWGADAIISDETQLLVCTLRPPTTKSPRKVNRLLPRFSKDRNRC
jgi:glycerophosphoryl diester phosphodiesterase